MMTQNVDTYSAKRGELETYFDRTASETWKRLTSDQKVSGIRATVRAGRDQMRAHLMQTLGPDLSGRRILDAGCGTGALSVEAAQRGAHVVAIDVAESLVAIARDRAGPAGALIDFRVGDMRDTALGDFDHVVAMDSLIHYRARDIISVLEALAPRVRRSILFTYAPGTLALMTMHMIGQLFPRSDRSPAIQPVSEEMIIKLITKSAALKGFRIASSLRVSRGFYKSQAVELVRV
jgi:magnesium-protoporphyrin O-methyltransferase